MKSAKTSKWIIFATIAAYGLIAVEIIIMISPFALYFYSIYGPLLDFLSSTPLTSWTTEFFLPHMVFPDDGFIIALSYLQFLFVVGLILFFSAAVPLYYGRFTRKGVVQNSFYRKIRHPQYLFLGISGLGLLLYWPRFIILILYITMLFVYYFLARNEEWRMQHEHPLAYEKYMQGTSMFLPNEPGARVYARLFGWLQPKWAGIAALYAVSIVVSVLVALFIRSYTINSLPVYNNDSHTLISVFPRPEKEVQKLYNVVDKHVLSGEQHNSMPPMNLAYIMPGDFFLMALVTDENRRFSEDMIERFPEILEWHQHKFKGGLGKFFRIFYNFALTHGSVETNYDIERFIFVRVTDDRGELVTRDDVLNIGVKRQPSLIVDVDADTHEVLSIVETTDSHKWGTMPMPSF